jgi:hypothetical protein
MGFLRFERVTYQLRSIDAGSGIDGLPGDCLGAAKEVVMVVYTARNDGEAPITAPALPRLTLTDPNGAAVPRDVVLTQSLARRTSPPLELRNGVLAPQDEAVLADVFLLPRNAIQAGPWSVRADNPASGQIRLPGAKRIDPPECPTDPAAP